MATDAQEALDLVGEMASWMRANLTYQGPNGTDRCHTCRADLGGEYRPALPHKPGCHAASLLERAGQALATEATPSAPRRESGVDLIAAERQRQITEEGWDAAHDAGHSDDLALAGASYALFTNGRRVNMDHESLMMWPWATEWWKPTDRKRNLVKAGALIAAAIDALAHPQSDD